jgi:single-strand DNA-binding protein
MINRVVLVGRLVADPETGTTPSGIAKAQFRIAVDRPISQEARNAGETRADFITIVCWRQNAEYAERWLTKGRLVGVEGRLQIREYVTNDGQQRKVAEIIADNLKGLDKAREATEDAGAGQDGYADNTAYAQPRAAAGGYEQRPAAQSGGYSNNSGGSRARAAQPQYEDAGDDLSDPFAE